jgi:hypothetical protein
MRLAVLFGVVGVAGCASESGGGGYNSFEPEDWYASTGMIGPLTFDAARTRYEYTLEGSIVLTASDRIGFREVTGVDVIGEIPVIGTGARIRVTIAREGEEPGVYGSDLAQGPYTHGHADPHVLDPLPSCYVPPCTATERYTLTLETVINPAGSVEFTWRALLHASLDIEMGEWNPPAADESLMLRVVEPIQD